jgi:hypothetical protein
VLPNIFSIDIHPHQISYASKFSLLLSFQSSYQVHIGPHFSQDLTR